MSSPVIFPLGTVPVPATANCGDGALPSLAALGAADLAPLLERFRTASTTAAAGSRIAAVAEGMPVASTAATVSTIADSDVLRGGLWVGHGLDPEPRAVMRFVGGETAALARLRAFVWGSEADGSGGATSPLRTYKMTRNGLIGAAYSSKLSPYLAAGCVSPRTVRAAIVAHEAMYGANDSTVSAPLLCHASCYHSARDPPDHVLP